MNSHILFVLLLLALTLRLGAGEAKLFDCSGYSQEESFAKIFFAFGGCIHDAMTNASAICECTEATMLELQTPQHAACLDSSEGMAAINLLNEWLPCPDPVDPDDCKVFVLAQELSHPDECVEEAGRSPEPFLELCECMDEKRAIAERFPACPEAQEVLEQTADRKIQGQACPIPKSVPFEVVA